MPDVVTNTITRTEFIQVGTQGPPGALNTIKTNALLVDEASATTVYRGEAAQADAAPSDPVWRITRIDIIQSPFGVTTTVANFGSFNCAWTERASYTYTSF